MYNLPKHEELIRSIGGQDLSRYDLARKLSRDWTVAHPSALELDTKLVKVLRLRGLIQDQSTAEATDTKKATQGPKPKASPKPKPQIEKGATTKSTDDNLVDKMEALKTLLRTGPSHGPVKFDDLDDDLKRKISTQPQLVQYQAPNQDPGPVLAKSNIPAFQKIVDDIILGQNVFLVGGAGTGKTTLAQNAAVALGREYMTINCSQWTAPTEIIGGQTLDGYQEGKLIEAWKNGYLLILDELPKIDPNTAGLFNDALAKSKIPGALIFNSRKEKFERHPNFAVIATGNVWPIAESVAYGANNKQDLSLLDRFAGCVYTIEKNPELEQQVVGSMILWVWCAELRRIIEDLRYEAQISMRFMMTCRDTLLLELQRLSEGGVLSADKGKTLEDCFTSYLTSNFTEVQRKTIKDRFGTEKQTMSAAKYSVIEEKQYRSSSWHRTLVQQLTASGYLQNGSEIAGLGSIRDTGFRRYYDGN